VITKKLNCSITPFEINQWIVFTFCMICVSKKLMKKKKKEKTNILSKTSKIKEEESLVTQLEVISIKKI
jgi:hypothetical protein